MIAASTARNDPLPDQGRQSTAQVFDLESLFSNNGMFNRSDDPDEGNKKISLGVSRDEAPQKGRRFSPIFVVLLVGMLVIVASFGFSMGSNSQTPDSAQGFVHQDKTNTVDDPSNESTVLSILGAQRGLEQKLPASLSDNLTDKYTIASKKKVDKHTETHVNRGLLQSSNNKVRRNIQSTTSKQTPCVTNFADLQSASRPISFEQDGTVYICPGSYIQFESALDIGPARILAFECRENPNAPSVPSEIQPPSSPTLEHQECILDGQDLYQGIILQTGSLFVDGITFTRFVSDGENEESIGGAVVVNPDHTTGINRLEVTDCTFRNNTSRGELASGAAIGVLGFSLVTLRNTTIQDNHVAGNSFSFGGILSMNAALTVTMEGVTFERNLATGFEVEVPLLTLISFYRTMDVTITDSVFRDNQVIGDEPNNDSDHPGSVIQFFDGFSPGYDILVNNRFENNIGVAVDYISSNDLEVRGNRFEYNRGHLAGALYWDRQLSAFRGDEHRDNLQVESNIFVGNQATNPQGSGSILLHFDSYDQVEYPFATTYPYSDNSFAEGYGTGLGRCSFVGASVQVQVHSSLLATNDEEEDSTRIHINTHCVSPGDLGQVILRNTASGRQIYLDQNNGVGASASTSPPPGQVSSVLITWNLGRVNQEDCNDPIYVDGGQDGVRNAPCYTMANSWFDNLYIFSEDFGGNSWEEGILAAELGTNPDEFGRHVWEFHATDVDCRLSDSRDICFVIRNRFTHRKLYASIDRDYDDGFGGDPGSTHTYHDQRWEIMLV